MMKLSPIVISLLDTDLYKFTMGQVIFHKHTNLNGTYIFKCRNKDIVFTEEMVKEINAQIDHLCTLTFTDEEAAKAAQLVERDSYSAMVRSAGLTDDPFTSSYDTNGITMTVTHQAEGEDINSKTARILGFYVVKGEPVTDIDTLLDTYETDGYTCVEK